MRKLVFIIFFTVFSFFSSIENSNAEFILYNVEEGHLNSDMVTSAAADDSGNIWIGQANYGISKYIFEQSIWLNYRTYNSGLINDYVTDISFDSLGYAWISTLLGFCRFDGVTGWEQYNRDDSLLYLNINKIAVDNSDEIWLGYFGSGIVHFDRDTTFRYFTVDSGLLDNRVLALFVDDSGYIWVGGYSGVCRFDGNSSWIYYTVENSDLLDDTVRAITQDSTGNMWFGSNSGLSKLNTDVTWTTFYEGHNCPYPLINITALDVDDSGHIWIGHNYSQPSGVRVNKYDGVSEWITADIDHDPSVNYTKVTDIDFDLSGDALIATYGEGVTRVVGELTDYGLDIFDSDPDALPKDYLLSQNYPNPFNSLTIIEYSIPAKTKLSITVYNILGQRINELFDGFKRAGRHHTYWDGKDLYGHRVASGIYLYHIQTGDFSIAKKMILLK